MKAGAHGQACYSIDRCVDEHNRGERGYGNHVDEYVVRMKKVV
jgi:hypothetical protein